MNLLLSISSYIIDGWLWTKTWGIYQIPISACIYSMLLKCITKKKLFRSCQLGFMLYALSMFVYWFVLFFPVHHFSSNNYLYKINPPSASHIAFVVAFLYSIIQLTILYLSHHKKFPSQIFAIAFISNIIGALLSLYFLRFVETVLDW